MKRQVLITGGSSGIGLGLAQRFLSAGIRVMVTGRDGEKLKQAARENPNGCLNIDNSMVNIPLKTGANTLLIGLVYNFYSWGIIARLRSLSGITLANYRQGEEEAPLSSPHKQ